MTDVKHTAEAAEMIEEMGGLTPFHLHPRKDDRAELIGALRDMLTEFDDTTITDELRTQIGITANTVKALQRARAALAKASGETP